MHVTPIKTRPLLPPQDDLVRVIDKLDLKLEERSVLAVSAKVVAIHQGRCIAMPDDPEAAQLKKDALIKQESEWYLERDEAAPWPRIFTIYEGTLCSSAGIDGSNGNGHWVLLPQDSSVFAVMLRERLCQRFGITELGIVVVDSRSYPMRNGTIGMTLGYAGLAAEYDYRGQTDIFGRTLQAERNNVADCLASTALLAMGEGNETTPLCCMTDVPRINFVETDDPADDWLALKVAMNNDVYEPFIARHDWRPGGRYTKE